MLAATSTLCAARQADFRSHRLAGLALVALLDEAELTPKPALVDGRGSGAHGDLSLDLMRRSAHAIAPFFAAMAECAAGREPSRALREELAAIGRDAERAMLHATAGSNAHKGAIWALGLLVAAASSTNSREPSVVASAAAQIALYHDRTAPLAVSHGHVVECRFGAGGAREEACLGFPHVLKVGLPALRQARQCGALETTARLDTLCSIVALLDDTCLLYRGGAFALTVARRGARAVLAAGGTGTAHGFANWMVLDAELLTLNASPGGSADLLAATLFLDALVADGDASYLALSPVTGLRRQELLHGSS